jgi:hypothetical protein
VVTIKDETASSAMSDVSVISPEIAPAPLAHLGVRPIKISKDIQRYPKIHRYPYSRISFGYLSGYLFGILLDIIWISLDIFMDTVKISQAYPLISSQYPELSIYLSRDIHLLIQRYPSTYPEISICLSRDLHLLIKSYPSTYPEISIHLSIDIHLFIQSYPSTYAEISCWIFDPVLAGPAGRCVQLL